MPLMESHFVLPTCPFFFDTLYWMGYIYLISFLCSYFLRPIVFPANGTIPFKQREKYQYQVIKQRPYFQSEMDKVQKLGVPSVMRGQVDLGMSVYLLSNQNK